MSTSIDQAVHSSLSEQSTSKDGLISSSNSTPDRLSWTPTNNRSRSDTLVSSSSSSSSSPGSYLRTPQSPSILGVLNPIAIVGTPIDDNAGMSHLSDEYVGFGIRRNDGSSRFKMGRGQEQSVEINGPGGTTISDSSHSRMRSDSGFSAIFDIELRPHLIDFTNETGSSTPTSAMASLDAPAITPQPVVPGPSVLGGASGRTETASLSSSERPATRRSSSTFVTLRDRIQKTHSSLHLPRRNSENLLSPDAFWTAPRPSPSIDTPTPVNGSKDKNGRRMTKIKALLLRDSSQPQSRTPSVNASSSVRTLSRRSSGMVLVGTSSSITEISELATNDHLSRAQDHSSFRTAAVSHRLERSALLGDILNPDANSTTAMKQIETQERSNADLFASMLPRELQLSIFKTLLESWEDGGEWGQWNAEDMGRKELIRLSRVSRYWQDLCFDGQLWSSFNIQPFAAKIHPKTLNRIIDTSRSYITSLSCRGLEEMCGETLLACTSLGGPVHRDTEQPAGLFTSLTKLDLRGSKALSSDDLCLLIENAPHLEEVNMKGLQSVTSEVIRTIARRSLGLKSLTISRCWNISLCDIVVFFRMLTPDQASRLTELRVAGVKGYGHTAAEFLPLLAETLVNLSILDVQGCTHLFDSDFRRYIAVFRQRGEFGRLVHLNISGCTSITPKTFEELAGFLPDLKIIEMAGLASCFRDRPVSQQHPDEKTLSLIKFFRSCPLLEKVDLEGTGLHGGVTDALLAALTPSRSLGTDDDYNSLEIGGYLRELRIGFARVTPEAIVRFIRGTPGLRVLEVDNTAANNAVMREFVRRRSEPTSEISLIDCRAINQPGYQAVASMTRPRRGWSGFASNPFEYTPAPSSVGDMAEVPVVKTFWSWKRVGVPREWRETREQYLRKVEDAPAEFVSVGSGVQRESTKRRGSGSSWWRAGEVENDDRGSCRIM